MLAKFPESSLNWLALSCSTTVNLIILSEISSHAEPCDSFIQLVLIAHNLYMESGCSCSYSVMMDLLFQTHRELERSMGQLEVSSRVCPVLQLFFRPG